MAVSPAIAEEPPRQELLDGGAVPPWLINSAALGWRLIAIAAFALALLAVANVLWVVTASIAVSVVVAAVFAPAVTSLRARGRSRNGAALIVWAASFGAISVAVLVLAIAFFPYLIQILQALDDGLTKLGTTLDSYSVPPVVMATLHQILTFVRSNSGGEVGGLISSIASAATVVILAIFLIFFLLRDGDAGWRWTFQALDDEELVRITNAGRDALDRVGGYLRGTTVLAAIIAATDFVFMVVLGTPLALSLAMLVFLGGYIPYVGGAITTLIVLVVTFSAQGSGAAIALLLLIAIRNLAVGYGIRPTLYGKTVHMHPAVVLLALPAGFQIAGVIGLFAAVPVTAVFLAVARAAVEVVEPKVKPRLPALVPAWLDRMAQISWRSVVLIGVGALAVTVFVTLPLVVLPIIGGLILAATLDQLVEAFIKRGWSRGVASGVAVVGSIIAIGAMLVLAAVALAGDGAQMLAAVNAGASSANTTAGGQLGLANQAVGDGTLALLQNITSFVQEFAGVAVIGLLSAILAFYFLKDGRSLAARVTSGRRPEATRKLSSAGSEAYAVLGGYMLGTAAISFVGAASQAVIMVLLGLPHVLPVFVLSFFLCFIPYIGGYISTGIAFLITIAVGTPIEIAIMFTWTMVFNIVQGNVIAPIVYARTVHIHPAVVLLAIPAGAAIAGIPGMFIAVPAIGVVAAVWRPLLSVLGTRDNLEIPPRDDTAGEDERSTGRPPPVPSGPELAPT